MSSVGDVFMNVIAPVLGLTLANVMFFSGVPEMLRCKKAGSLGDMTPGPFPVVLATCVGWMGYAILVQDYFVFFGAAPGSVIGMYFTLVGYGLTPVGSATRESLEKVVLLMSFSLAAVAFYLGLVVNDLPEFAAADISVAAAHPERGPASEHKQLVMGLFCNFVLVLYYASPLTTIKAVLAEKNSKSLYLPMAAANAANGAAWLVYGMALRDPYLMAPNGVGTVLGVSQMLLIRVYPSKCASLLAGEGARAPSETSFGSDGSERSDDDAAERAGRGREERGA
jgi:solute carrier family 50 protein (sugar transporter)